MVASDMNDGAGGDSGRGPGQGPPVHHWLIVGFLAVATAAAFAGFSVVMVNRFGVTDQTDAIIDNAKIATKAYVQEHNDLLITDIRNIADLLQDLRDEELHAARDVLNQRMAGYAFGYRLAGAFITDSQGNVLGGSNKGITEIPLKPDISRLKRGDPIVYVSDRQLSALMKLPGFSNALLFVTRDLNPELLGMFSETKKFIQDFEWSRARLRGSQFLFIAVSVSLALLSFTAAFILGMRTANLRNDMPS